MNKVDKAIKDFEEELEKLDDQEEDIKFKKKDVATMLAVMKTIKKGEYDEASETLDVMDTVLREEVLDCLSKSDVANLGFSD